MKRTYRITLVLEATFERKIRARSWAKRLAGSVKAPAPWKVTGTKVTSRAMPEVAPRVPDPAKLARDEEREKVVERLQGIADAMVRLAPGPTKRPRINIYPNRWCGPRWGDRMDHAIAHAHRDKRAVWGQSVASNGKVTHHRLGILWGLICIKPSYVDQLRANPSLFDVPDTTIDGRSILNAPTLVAHELAHLRRTRGRHTHRQEEAANLFLDLYCRWSHGEIPMPDRTPPWNTAR